MTSVSKLVVKRKLFSSDESSSESNIYSDADDSVKDKDYSLSSCSDESQSDSELEVSQI